MEKTQKIKRERRIFGMKAFFINTVSSKIHIVFGNLCRCFFLANRNCAGCNVRLCLTVLTLR